MDSFDFQTGENKKKKIDNFFLGFILSAIIPIVVMLLLLHFTTSSSNLESQFRALLHNSAYLIRFTTMSLIPNGLLFFYFYKTERWESSKGLILSTMLYVIVLVFCLGLN
jgi:K+ transporter